MTYQDRDTVILYKVYWGLVCSDALHKLGFDATEENKKILHNHHKKMLGYKTIADLTFEALSMFIMLVSIYWAERGIFVRTSGRQPWGMEDMALKDLWDVL